MSEPTVESSGDLPRTMAPRSDDPCVRYMSAWQSGHRRRIEEAIENCDPPLSEALIRHLMVLDLSRRRREGEVPTPGEYRARFPQHAELIDSLFRGLVANAGADRSGTAPPSM